MKTRRIPKSPGPAMWELKAAEMNERAADRRRLYGRMDAAFNRAVSLDQRLMVQLWGREKGMFWWNMTIKHEQGA